MNRETRRQNFGILFWKQEGRAVLCLGIHKSEPDIYIGFSPVLHLQCGSFATQGGKEKPLTTETLIICIKQLRLELFCTEYGTQSFFLLDLESLFERNTHSPPLIDCGWLVLYHTYRNVKKKYFLRSMCRIMSSINVA